MYSSLISRLSFVAILASILNLASLPANAQSFVDGLDVLEAGDSRQTVEIWTALAGQGDLEAQYGLALLYEAGTDQVPSDINKAVGFYELAAEAGLAEAQTNLGLILAEGRGVEVNQSRAVELWDAAARQNNAIAQFNLGLAYFAGQGIENDTEEAIGLILVAAAQGLPEAHFAMGQFYLRGLGVTEDPAVARYFLEEAVKVGNQNAVALVEDLESQGVVAANIDEAAAQGLLPKLPELLKQSAPLVQQAAVPEAKLQIEATPAISISPEVVSPAVEQVKQASPVFVEPEIPSIQSADIITSPEEPLSPLFVDAGPEVEAAPTLRPEPRPTQQLLAAAPSRALSAPKPVSQPQPRQSADRGLRQSPEGMVILGSQRPATPLYALWLGTVTSTAQGAELWGMVERLDPEVMSQIDPLLEPIQVGRKQGYRLLAGPLPSVELSWQVCNAVKAGNMRFFCKARGL